MLRLNVIKKYHPKAGNVISVHVNPQPNESSLPEPPADSIVIIHILYEIHLEFLWLCQKMIGRLFIVFSVLQIFKDGSWNRHFPY
jgi:hypothetical protein